MMQERWVARGHELGINLLDLLLFVFLFILLRKLRVSR
jgi:hypothetical protein